MPRHALGLPRDVPPVPLMACMPCLSGGAEGEEEQAGPSIRLATTRIELGIGIIGVKFAEFLDDNDYDDSEPVFGSGPSGDGKI